MSTLTRRRILGYGTSMFTGSFDRAYRRLVRAFKRHEDAPRSTADIAVIGDARWELHLARSAMAVERDQVLALQQNEAVVVRKMDVSEEDLARLSVAAVSAGFG